MGIRLLFLSGIIYLIYMLPQNFFRLDYFNINKVNVTDNSKMLHDELTKLTEKLYNKNSIYIDSNEIKEFIEKDIRVESATVEKKSLGEIDIDVKEKDLAYYAVIGKNIYLTDKEGKIFAYLNEKEVEGVPFIIANNEEEIKVISEEEGRKQGLIIELDSKIDDDYIAEIKKQTLKTDIPGKEDFKIVYTPLHGTGGRPMKRILSGFGYSFEVVKEQIEPDGNFPTVVYANPEEVAAFKLGTALADKTGAKIVMANDPDADRIGIAVKDDNDEWYYPNGNQVGLLLLQYLLNNKKDIPANAKVITTIVSTPMIDVIAPAKNVGVMKTLTGFKYIGEKIRQFENKELDGSYLFGFEESYGYLIGTHARDKDALVTSMIIAEMAAYYNSIGSSIYKELQKLYREFGFYLEGIKSVTLKGKDGIEKMAELMAGLRENVKDTVIGKKIKIKRDFDSHKEYNLETGEVKEIHLPKENVLQFVLEDNTYITARPSGTEPKIKFYFSVNTSLSSVDAFEATQKVLDSKIQKIVEELKLK